MALELVKRGREQGRTHEDVDLVRAGRHVLVVVAVVQLAECRQARRAHPDLEVLVGAQVRQSRLVRVAVRVALGPVRRRDDVGRGVLGLLVLVVLAGPCDALVGHVVRDVGRRARRVEEDRLREGVCERGREGSQARAQGSSMRAGGEQARTVEDRVGDEAARVDGLAVAHVDRLAVAARDRVVRARAASELVRVDRLDVAAVVLVIVGDCAHEQQPSQSTLTKVG